MEEEVGTQDRPVMEKVIEADATLVQTEQKLKEQEVEKEFSSMTMPQLIEWAKARKVDTKGDKGTVVIRLFDEAMGRTRTAEKILLETAIMTWSMYDIKVYLH